MTDAIVQLRQVGFRRGEKTRVTHHIEEIRRWITDVLILKDGLICAAGTKDEIITTQNLSDAFDCPCLVEKQPDEQYSLKIHSRKGEKNH